MPPFRAVSLDLWFTTLYFERADEAAWKRARVASLDRNFRDPDDRAFGATHVTEALDVVRSEFQHAGQELDVVSPSALVRAVADRLGARIPAGLAAASDAYAGAGIDVHPPRLADGVAAVARTLEARGVPLIAITNTARPEAVWRALFQQLGGPHFRHIVTSCEVGSAKPDPAIFRAAVGRLGLPASDVLHVGDRWELDVVGARAAGLSPVVFRGLWARYPAAGYGDGSLPPNDGPGAAEDPAVPRIDRFEELLDEDRFPIRTA